MMSKEQINALLRELEEIVGNREPNDEESKGYYHGIRDSLIKVLGDDYLRLYIYK